MTPPLEYRAWDKFNGEYYYSDKFPSLAAFFTHVQQAIDGGNDIQLQQYTGQNSIDDQKVFAGDLMRFPETEQVYEVRYDNDEGAWGIFYKDMNCFKIGMARFMVLTGNVFEGEITTDHKEAA